MPQKITRLNSGLFVLPEVMGETPPLDAPIPAFIDRDVMMVYAGKFLAMDGEVEVTKKDLERLAAKRNGVLTKLRGVLNLGAEVPLKHCPPIQLDHSTAATHTVGRLIGDFVLGKHMLEDGKEVDALFSRMRILGRENVEKVLDGRWTHLSVGADFPSGTLSELTITPFPAAAEASLMSKLAKEVRYKGATIYVNRYSDGEYEAYVADDYIDRSPKFTSNNEAEAVGEAKALIDKVLKSQGETEFSKLAQRQNSGSHRGLNYEVWHEPGKGYFAIGLGEAKAQIARRFFDKHEQAEEHAEAEIDGYLDSELSSGDKEGSKLTSSVVKTIDIGRGAKIIIINYGGAYGFEVLNKNGEKAEDGDGYDTVEQAVSEAKKAAAGSKLSEGEGMDKEKLKKHLMATKQLSEEDAEKHLAALSDEDTEKLSAEVKDAEDKLAAEEEEKAKLAAEQDEKDKTELSQLRAARETRLTTLAAKKAEIVKLSTDFRAGAAKARLAIKTSRITARLSRLRADAKVTPAEVKNLNIAELASKSDEAVEAALSTFEARQPVIDVGQYGSLKAEGLDKIAMRLRAQGMSDLEMQSRANMPSKRRLMKLQEGKENEAHVTDPAGDEQPDFPAKERGEGGEGGGDTSPRTEVSFGDFDASTYALICGLLDEGKLPEAKEQLRRFITKGLTATASAGAHETLSEDVKTQMSALEESLGTLENQLEQITKLATEEVG